MNRRDINEPGAPHDWNRLAWPPRHAAEHDRNGYPVRTPFATGEAHVEHHAQRAEAAWRAPRSRVPHPVPAVPHQWRSDAQSGPVTGAFNPGSSGWPDASALPAGMPAAGSSQGLWWLHDRTRSGVVVSASRIPVLEDRIGELTAQIETLRSRFPNLDPHIKPTQDVLDEIVAPMMHLLPLAMIETLQKDIRDLDDRIESSIAAGTDARLLHSVTQGLDDVRATLQALDPYGRLGAFHSAVNELANGLSQRRETGPGSLQSQIETVIHSLRDVSHLASSKPALAALSEEVRGLTARLQRVVTQNASASSQPELPPENATAIGDQLPERIAPETDEPQSKTAPEAAADSESSAQKALEAVQSTLSGLVDQLVTALRDAQIHRHTPPLPHISPDHANLLRGHADPVAGAPGYAHADLEALARTRGQYASTNPLSRRDSEVVTPRRAIVIPIRSLLFGGLVIVLASAGARVSMYFTDLPMPTISRAGAVHVARQPEPDMRLVIADKANPAEPEVPDLVRSQAPDSMAAVERPAPRSLGEAEYEVTGTIGRQVPIAAGSRAAAHEPSLPLPDTMPSALRLEAAKGKSAAEYEVGVRLVEGKSVPVNAEEGLRWLRRAAKSGVIPAHLWIGSLYEKGLGVERDLMQARTHYMAAAEKGNAKAMHNLAVLYAEGIDGRRDYKTAARWFQRASERGIADSQYNYAILLMRGIGVEQNHQDAYKWFALAALQGDREAARHRDEVGSKLEPGLLATARSAVQQFTPQLQPNEAVVVSTPPGGWDRTSSDSAKGRKSSGIFARGAS